MSNLLNRNQVEYSQEELERAKQEAHKPFTWEDFVTAVLNVAAWVWLALSIIVAIAFGIESAIYGILILGQGCAVWAMMMALAIIIRRLDDLQYKLDKK